MCRSAGKAKVRTLRRPIIRIVNELSQRVGSLKGSEPLRPAWRPRSTTVWMARCPIMFTHDLGVVAELCDRVYVMQAGKVVETGSTIDLFENPQHSYTARLIRLSMSRIAEEVAP